MKINNEKEDINNTHSFAKGLNIYKLFWIFYIGCFCGVVVETLWCIITNGYFEYRTSMILEPLNPVYGFGAVLISIFFAKCKGWKNIFIFIASFIIGGLFECCCSLFQEFVFGTVSWNYTPKALGILGNRTSLIYCIFWGFLGILWVRIIYPFISSLIEKIPNKIGKIVTLLLAVLVSFDIVFSSTAVLRQKSRRKNIPPQNKIDTFFDTHFDDETLKFFYHNITIRD